MKRPLASIPATEEYRELMRKRQRISVFPLCKLCGEPMPPDYFGNTFDECSECVAARWLDEMVKTNNKRGRFRG